MIALPDFKENGQPRWKSWGNTEKHIKRSYIFISSLICGFFSVLTCFIYLDVCVLFSFRLYYIQREGGVKTWVSYFSGLLISPKIDSKGLDRKAVSLPPNIVILKRNRLEEEGKDKEPEFRGSRVGAGN